MKTALASIFAASVLAAPALAAEPAWKVVDYKGTTSLIAERGDVAFRCVDDKLRFIVATEGDIEKLLRGTPRHGHVKSAKIAMHSGTASSEQVYYFASRKMIVSGADQTGRAMFNAAIRGEAVSISVDDDTPLSIEWPEAEATAFNDFKAACEL